MNLSAIDEYEKAAGKLRAAVAGLTPTQLNAVPIPGTWSIQQIVVHIMDSDLIWTDRIKRVIAEENPTIIGYDESKFVARLHYELWPIEDALTIFELNRKNFAKVLRALPDDVMEHTGMHNEAGKLRMGDMVPRVTRHVDHHLKFIHQKRAMVEKGK